MPVCVRASTQIAQSSLASCQFTTVATLPACRCARPPQAPLGSGGRFITHANNMTLCWKGPLTPSDEGNRGQRGEWEWRKNETPDGYVNVLGMLESTALALCLALSLFQPDSVSVCQRVAENVIPQVP